MSYYLVEIKEYNSNEKINILIAAVSYKEVLKKVISEYIRDDEVENIKISFLCDMYEDLPKSVVDALKEFGALE